LELLDHLVEPLEEKCRLVEGGGADLRDESYLLAQQLGGRPVVVEVLPCPALAGAARQ
jgi:hypothetical protein